MMSDPNVPSFRKGEPQHQISGYQKQLTTTDSFVLLQVEDDNSTVTWSVQLQRWENECDDIIFLSVSLSNSFVYHIICFSRLFVASLLDLISFLMGDDYYHIKHRNQWGKEEK